MVTMPSSPQYITLDKTPRARFVGGTIVLDHVDRATSMAEYWQWHEGKWRCPAVHYREVRPWLKRHSIQNYIPRWQSLTLKLDDSRKPHLYQREALQAWQQADCWGSVVLPTGAGKTFLALMAIQALSVSTLVVVPTIDLLHQWYARLENLSHQPIGVWYGQEKIAHPITVTTYPSAWSHAETLGNQFKLLVFDEIHHLPAPSWHEIAIMCAAPYRLGLTATYPDQYGADASRANSSQSSFFKTIDPLAMLNQYVGPVLYRKAIDDLTGEQLAEYRTQRIRVNLTPAEQAMYDEAHATYLGYVREARLRESHGPVWWDEFTRRSAYEVEARRAKVAELKLKEIVHQAQGKLEVLDQLLREHQDLPMLIFTAHNRFAYKIARLHLVPVITHQTNAAERKAILEGFREGEYRAIVTTKVLNEGVDVPTAKVAVVLGGSASAREYVQRLGRVLRKHGQVEAILYEVIARKTVDEQIAQRRKPKS